MTEAMPAQLVEMDIWQRSNSQVYELTVNCKRCDWKLHLCRASKLQQSADFHVNIPQKLNLSVESYLPVGVSVFAYPHICVYLLCI